MGHLLLWVTRVWLYVKDAYIDCLVTTQETDIFLIITVCFTFSTAGQYYPVKFLSVSRTVSFHPGNNRLISRCKVASFKCYITDLQWNMSGYVFIVDHLFYLTDRLEWTYLWTVRDNIWITPFISISVTIYTIRAMFEPYIPNSRSVGQISYTTHGIAYSIVDCAFGGVPYRFMKFAVILALNHHCTIMHNNTKTKSESNNKI